MNYLSKTITAIISAVAIGFSVYGQKPSVEFGEISGEELSMTSYAKEPDAPAVILFDFCIISVDIDANGIKANYNHTRRVKIFTKEGYDWSTFSVMLYHNESQDEEISGLKGFTYNLVDGQVVKSKLDKSSVFTEKVDKNKDRYKFTFPDVKEGSIIEFSYKKSSDYISQIDPWYFQKSIPVAWSELYFKVPEYFNFLHISGGYEAFAQVDPPKSQSTTVSYHSTERSGNLRTGINSNISTSTLTFDLFTEHWTAKDMPSLKDEKYVGNLNDYCQKIEFQLASTNFNGVFEDQLGTWETINRRLTEEVENFGKNMMKKNFYESVLDTLIKDGMTPDHKAMVISDFVASSIKWNDIHDYLPDKNIKKVYDDKVGSSSEINALLISMLRAADLNVEPVIISTRDNGLVHPIYPLLNKFNHLIASVWFGDKILLLDASDPNVPAGMLPRKCLNGTGRCISASHNSWLKLDAAKGNNVINICTYRIADNKYIGEMQVKKTGYAAVDSKIELKMSGEEKFIENFKRANPGWVLSGYTLEVSPGNADEMKESYNFETSDGLTISGNLIYFDPVSGTRFDENPLKEDARIFPVDFGEPVSEKYLINIKVPDGYAAEEVPKPVRMALPDKSASFSYLAQAVDSVIQVSTTLEIKKSLYLPEEYKSLREFFSM
ncbi:MAG TPA: hypothetical protein VI583_10165, partial [Cyclobacteriaceae bacterium]|nr:hypothetical protein [Cyclobacteriaceae bacterium]